MKRIIILGNAGAGKTTLARRLAERLDLPHTELDALYWDPGWTPAPKDVFRERVSRAAGGDRWVMDGNYSSVRDLLWSRADTAIWLDYPLPLTLWWLLKRTLGRVLSGRELWNGNRERFADAFFSRGSLFLYVLKTHRRRRQQFLDLFQRREYPQINVLAFHSRRELETWVRSPAQGWLP